mmetsp:Transcript_13263/g.38461  ORF Transcript_13263/g.38461 Transcript_13263/m.38461 type:complete len:347 (+) Transcript_13263:1822-2862(+)
MSRPVRSSRKQVDYALGDGGEEPAAVGNGGVPVEETPDVVPAKKRGRPKPRVPVKKAPAKKAASKKDSKKKNVDSDEDDYVPEKEEPDEAFDIKLEEEADDVNPAEDEEDGEDGDAGDLYRVKKRGKRANVSKSRKKKEPKRSGRTIVRVDPVTLEHKRVLDTHVEADVGDPEFERQLVEFLETGMCPKCQSTLKRAHERHLKLCRGPTEDTIRRNNEREVMASLPPEVLKGKTPDAARMKLMARLRKVSIKGVKETDGNVDFIVSGSTGRNYEVALRNGSRTGPYSGFPRKCNCVDARTKRHDCKHCVSVILRLGFDLDVTDEEWNQMWRIHYEDALESGDIRKL